MKKYLATRIMKNIMAKTGGRYSFKYNDFYCFIVQEKPEIRCYEAWEFILNNLGYVL